MTIETISKETNHEVEDQHFSEKGQKTLAETIINVINGMGDNTTKKLI